MRTENISPPSSRPDFIDKMEEKIANRELSINLIVILLSEIKHRINESYNFLKSYLLENT